MSQTIEINLAIIRRAKHAIFTVISLATFTRVNRLLDSLGYKSCEQPKPNLLEFKFLVKISYSMMTQQVRE